MMCLAQKQKQKQFHTSLAQELTELDHASMLHFQTEVQPSLRNRNLQDYSSHNIHLGRTHMHMPVMFDEMWCRCPVVK